jgi:hypothetical protein
VNLRLEKPISAVRFAVKCLGFAAVGVLYLPAGAQQAIHFSKPSDQDPAVTAGAFEHPASHANPNAFNAPSPLFGAFGSSPDNNAMSRGAPAPVFSNPNAALWQKALQDRKNWALMTPEQILGIPTPESILGVANQRDDAKLSPEQRYLNRREEEAQAAATNGARSSISSAPSSVWANIDTSAEGFQQTDNKNEVMAPNGRQTMPQLVQNRGAFFNQSAPSSAGAASPANSIWSSAFQSPDPTPKSTPEQLAGMEKFRALLESPPPQPLALPDSYSAPAAAKVVDPFLQAQPASYNPSGSSPAAMESGISRPVGITPLSGITGLRPIADKPTSLVQPPPWMSQTPKIGTLPQRQF